MSKRFFVLIVLFVTAFVFLQAQALEIFQQEGIASWYGREYEGRPTASGEIFDSSQLTAAHPYLPFGTVVVVTNLHNNRSVTVRINDRGPFVPGRIIDVSRAAAEQLDMIITGTAPVTVVSVERLAITAPAAETQTITQVMQPVTAPVAQSVVPDVQPTTATTSSSQPVIQPVVAAATSQLRLVPQLVIIPDKNYRLQIGSYRVARNAADTFEKLQNAGLTPAYERYTDSENIEYYRVVVAGVRGTDVQSTAEKILSAGFMEALIREEN